MKKFQKKVMLYLMLLCMVCIGSLFMKENIYAAKSDRRLVKFPNAVKYKKYGLINVEPHLNIKNVSISNLHRTELVTAEPTLWLFENSTVSNITLSNITSENHTDEKSMPIAVLDAKVSNLRYDGLFEDDKIVDL